MDFAYILLIAFAVFLVVFVRTELGLYLVIFSMLLSPKLGSGSGELAEGRRVVIRTEDLVLDRKSTRLNSSHGYISYAVFCLKKKKNKKCPRRTKINEQR